MTQDEDVAALEAQECWRRLAGQELGRLVTHVGEVFDIFPVNYVVDGETVLFRTAEGSKLFELTANSEVLFEVDHHTPQDAWSVVVRGHAERLETSEEVARADALPLTPWIPTLKYNYVRVVPSSVSGRAFHRGPEPDRYGVQEY
ncbi:MAG: pyridoxamine 5'-phosphate oxidase family protein [Microbacterium sp.]|uniref:pyridoxamine 5'-phosphate oxidase family protein n=1 Tax=Microbacterium sp. TaxID=51671 RepID=UPI00092A9190|nr:pyridoxamine 5'-phosphate oxidase family protein [Microbacterium sp.]OJU67647.1 MAG: pyridoxamine 5-phosphate oxidase [Microbacterium sp. 70-38]MBN9180190.1 pyridoxamine 5'-phosphate oxidase family protein [Microbacterium sp.]MBN9190952.1 pyridoxamine 5'-phosphate oxidase family protein [Microbacterium sp.]MBN9193415.1 pyridoxamine 5'-phosphate oxidase family protein [Microbacterium sp.]MBN9194896.1 pyridoxamine 5'-phosphate oxidase family protein [Microbacterium sp.]